MEQGVDQPAAQASLARPTPVRLETRVLPASAVRLASPDATMAASGVIVSGPYQPSTG